MPQEDYLKKRIDQSGKVLTKLLDNFLKLKSAGKINEAIQQTDLGLEQLFNLDPQQWRSLSSEQFNSKLRETKLNDHNLNLLAELFFQSAMEYTGEDGVKYRNGLFKKVLVIYDDLNSRENTYSMERHFRIERIKSFLDGM
jgi:hypothetical protein